MQAAIDVEVVDYSERYGDAFGSLNREWLEAFFEVEPVDQLVLDDPQGRIIDHGGVILYLVFGDEAVGTVALKHHNDGVFELTKMAVTPACHGRGYGRRLLSAAIDRFAELGGKKLYLESHSSLAAALTLYESAGFRHEAPPSPSEYQRADVYMRYAPEDGKKAQ